MKRRLSQARAEDEYERRKTGIGMKIGIHQHVFTKNLFDDNLDLMNVIRDYGFDSMDVNVRVLDLDGAKLIRKRAEGLGLHLMGGGSLPVDKELLSSDPEKRRDAIEYMKTLVRKVCELGSAFYGGIIYAPFSRLTGKAPTEEEFTRSAEGLREVARYAQGFGISVGLEPANRYEAYLINTIGDGLRLADAIGEKNVGILADTFHCSIEEKSLYAAIKAAGGRLLHLHVCANDRGTPGNDQIHWDDLFRAVKDIGYDGTVTIEGFVDATADVAPGACIWRKFASSPDEMATQGLSFIRSMLAKYGLPRAANMPEGGRK
jgi:D-psicose/D-tagatose/L-ribulose 3-epimerase